ncbi:hypothetical protein Bbelb_416830 [Branchiostoma belcheri]|nr:hypothetical protein Bbelb_416830 [Branchiostoma belcheri]
MLIDCLDNNFLHQHVTEPTRFRASQRPSLLDLVITNDHNTVGSIEYLPGLGKGDHCCLRFHIEAEVMFEDHTIPRRNYNKGHYAMAGNLLQEVEWQKLLEDKAVQEAWGEFADILEKTVEECIPLSKPRLRANKLYMNKRAMRARERKRKAWAKFRQSGKTTDYVKYAKERNKLRSVTRELCSSFEHRMVKDIKNNPKAFWRYVKSRLQCREKVGSLIREDGTVAETDGEKAEVLNEFFASVFTSEDLTSIPSIDRLQSPPLIQDFEFTEELVLKKLTELNPSKSSGPDGIHPRFLKEMAHHLALPLSILFNKSMEAAELPEGWKEAHVSPIHKKGSKTAPGNYRPVSLTSVIGKLMESIIRDKLVEHMMEFNLFTDAQHGFVPGRSCMTQLLVVMEEWTRLLQEGKPLDVVYLDFRKAFDTVPHVRLLRKLERYGVGGNIRNWVEDFLRLRKQRVVVNGQFSSWREVKSGIPQGSVLGPILFVIYINDLPEAVASGIKIFADDSKLYKTVHDKTGEDALQQDLNTVGEWSQAWQLLFNVTKCKVLHLGRTNQKNSYSLGGQTIEETVEEKDLGVTIDNQLSFHSHTAKAANKGNQVLGLIKRTFYNLDKDTVPTLFKTMVRPHLEYGNVIWGPHYSLDQQKVEAVQRRATKLVSGLRELPYSERLKRLRLPSLGYRRRRGDMIQVFKFLTGQERVQADNFFELAGGTTRGHNFKLKVPLAKSRSRQHVFSVRVIKDWNSLPPTVVSSETVNQFKTRLDRHWEHLKTSANKKDVWNRSLQQNPATGTVPQDAPWRGDAYVTGLAEQPCTELRDLALLGNGSSAIQALKGSGVEEREKRDTKRYTPPSRHLLGGSPFVYIVSLLTYTHDYVGHVETAGVLFTLPKIPRPCDFTQPYWNNSAQTDVRMRYTFHA